MNLTDAAVIKVNGKEVQQIKIDGNIVYTAGYRIRITTDNPYILTGETATLTVTCEDLPNTNFELYNVIDMTRTKIADLTTDSSGKATYNYTGEGVGEIGFVAVYSGKESNTVVIDDYIPVPVMTPSATSISTIYGNTREWSVTVKDQHGEVMVGETVSFYDGNTYLSSSTTNSNGRAYISLSTFDVGEYTLTAHLDGIISTSCAVTISKADTWLGIDTPLLVYSDMFDVNGTLKRSTSSGNGVVGETVTLHWKVGSGAEQTATTETTTGGAFNFHKGPVATMSPYTFWITYSGSNNYNGSNSSEVDVNPVKESTVLNITSPAPEQSVSNTVLVTGTLKDNDGTAMSGESVSFSLNNVSQGTATVGSDGGFSKTLTGLVTGSNEISVSFASTATHSGSAHTIEVVCSSFDGIDLDSDKSILSKADNEYATLTAQLTYEDTPVSVSGETVTFEVRKVSDDSLVETLTADTNSSGVATVSYYGKGVGDIYIKAECNLLIQLYEVQDMRIYDDASSDKSSMYVSRSIGNGKSASVSYANNEYHLTASGSGISWYGVSPLSLSTSDNWEFIATVKTTGTGNFIPVGLAKSGADHIEHILYPRNNPTTYAVFGYGSPQSYLIANTNVGLATNTYYTFKIRLVNGEVSLKVYNGETLIIDNTYTLPSNYENITVYPVISNFGNDNVNNNSNYFKEYSIKSL